MVAVAVVFDYLLRDEGGVIDAVASSMGGSCFSKTLILGYIFVLNTEIELDT